MTQSINMPWSSPSSGELPQRWRGVRMVAMLSDHTIPAAEVLKRMEREVRT